MDIRRILNKYTLAEQEKIRDFQTFNYKKSLSQSQGEEYIFDGCKNLLIIFEFMKIHVS